MPIRVRAVTAACLAGLAAGVSAAAGVGCAGPDSPGAGSSGRLTVLAAENFWGSIAAQVGGQRVSVRSVITNPATDPHAYEPTANDAVALADARLAIITGAGYDSWASRLLAADSGGSTVVLDVGKLVGVPQGGNPHVWYSPPAVERVLSQVTADLCRVDARDCGYFVARRAEFDSRGLALYHRLIADIRRRFGGVAVGYSESIFAPLGRALGLRLITPYRFADAVAEGSEVTAADVETVDGQATRRAIKVWIYNSQNATPEVERVNVLARAARIPTATITETLTPAGSSFQDWQAAQLLQLERALHLATGR